MDVNRKELSDIKDVLKDSPRGMTVTEVSKAIGMNRHSVAKYLEVMVTAGHVDMKSFGPSKVYYLSQRVPLSAMLSFSSDLIVIIDKDLLIRNANDRFLETMGLTREKALNRNIENFLKPVSIATTIMSHIHEALGGKDLMLDTSFTRDSDEVYYTIKFIPTVFDDGDKGVTLIMTDVTGHRRIEKAISDSERKFRGMISQSTDGITLCDESGMMIEYNESMAKLTGHSRESIIGKYVWEVPFFITGYESLKGRGQTSLEELVKIFLKAGASPINEKLSYFDIPRGNGTTISVMTNIFPIKTEKGYMLAAIVRDVTVQKQMEEALKHERAELETRVKERTVELEEVNEALRKSEERFRNLVENINDIAWEMDERARFTYVNSKIKDILGYGPEHYLGKVITEFMPAEDVPKFSDGFNRIYARPRPYNLEHLRMFHKDGSTHPMEVNGMPFYDNKGNFKGFHGVTRDISLRKSMDELVDILTYSMTHPDVATFRAGLDAGIGYANDAASLLLGYTTQEINALGMDDIDPAYSEAKWREHMEMLKEHRYAKSTGSYRAKDGKSIPVEVTENYAKFNGKGYSFFFVRPIA